MTLFYPIITLFVSICHDLSTDNTQLNKEFNNNNDNNNNNNNNNISIKFNSTFVYILTPLPRGQLQNMH